MNERKTICFVCNNQLVNVQPEEQPLPKSKLVSILDSVISWTKSQPETAKRIPEDQSLACQDCQELLLEFDKCFQRLSVLGDIILRHRMGVSGRNPDFREEEEDVEDGKGKQDLMVKPNCKLCSKSFASVKTFKHHNNTIHSLHQDKLRYNIMRILK
jgi:hypothetical protein